MSAVFKKNFEEIQVGDTASLVKRITESDLKKFVEMTGDNNPLHVDRAYAENTPFKDIVVHGMLGASFISTLIGTQLPGEGALWMAQSLEFLLPVRLGDELTISCKVIKKLDRQRMLEMETTILNQNKALVLTGLGKIRVLEPIASAVSQTPTAPLKVALVTGGTGGIGRAICLRLAQAGYAVGINYRNQEDRAFDLVRQIEAKNGRAIALRGDITQGEDVHRMVDQVVKAFGGISLLVNNASPKIQPKSFDFLEWEDIRGQLDGQFKGAFLLSRACVPYFKKQGYGKIINITSQVLDGSPSPNWTSYAVGKSALSTFSQYLAAELGPSQIQVNCVSPGMTDTQLVGDIPEKARLIIARQAPLRRLATPEDVAGAVAFLASPEANYITGETIRVNGGQVMR